MIKFPLKYRYKRRLFTLFTENELELIILDSQSAPKKVRKSSEKKKKKKKQN